MLRVENLETYIEQFHILQSVTFEVIEGTITVLFGRNGAGKSTTLRTIMGFYHVSRGGVYYSSSLTPFHYMWITKGDYTNSYPLFFIENIIIM